MDHKDELKLAFPDADSVAEIHTARSWRGVSVQYSRLQLPVEYEFEWDGHSHYLAYHDLILMDGAMEILGERPIDSGDLRDKMTYVPLGQTIKGWAKPADRLNSFTVVCFDPATMEEELQVEFNSVEPRPHIYFQDRELGATMRKLGRLMADLKRPAAKVYAEAVGLTAALEMMRLQAEQALVVAKAGQLSQIQCRLVLDYIEAHLASDIGLEELASIAGMTRFHFSRAFKLTFGESPYQFVIHRRVERAKQLLLGSRMSIAEVAVESGFGSSSQFARTFRDFVNQTPLAFRRNT